jgi:hypothetical protein
MIYHVTKLDYRHSHKYSFDYMLEFSKNTRVGTGVLDFDRSRRWMNQTWGWSQDVETRSRLKFRKADPANTVVQEDDINTHWAYSVQYRDYRIYLNSDKELNWFVLAHPHESNR